MTMCKDVPSRAENAVKIVRTLMRKCGLDKTLLDTSRLEKYAK